MRNFRPKLEEDHNLRLNVSSSVDSQLRFKGRVKDEPWQMFEYDPSPANQPVSLLFKPITSSTIASSPETTTSTTASTPDLSTANLFTSTIPSPLAPEDKNLRLALFLGYSAYNNLRNSLFLNLEQIHNLLLAYVNQIQAIYYQKSLRSKLNIILVKIDVHKSEIFGTHGGQRDKILNEFCKYQQSLNPLDNSSQDHWDMALYLTSLNLYSVDRRGINDKTMGLSSVGSICSTNNNCVIVEFGSVNDLGRPFPSAGLMSTWIAAHEMAHK